MTGKYENILGAAGALADQDLTATTGKPSAVFAGAAVNLGKSFDQAIAAAVPPPPPPPPPGKMLVGSSGGAWGVAKMVGIVNPKIVRAFDVASAKAVPAGLPIVYSNDNGHNRGYDLDGATVGSPGYTSWMSELKSVFPDTAEHVAVWGHEEDIHGSDAVKLGRVYDGGRLVVDALNKGRKFPIKTAVVITGMPFDDTSASGYKKWNLKNADYLVSDNYARKHWDTIGAWAKSCNKPWGIGENGVQAQTDPNKYTDDQVAAAMTADLAAARAGGCSWFCYWPNGGNTLVNRPKSTAALKAACAA